MSIQTLIKGVGGTIETYFLDRQVTSCVVTVCMGTGAQKVTRASCTCDSVSTTTAAIGATNDATLTVSSASGLVVGRRYLVGAADGAEPREVVSVKNVTGSVLTLRGPLMNDHASGATVKGLRVSYAVASTACDVLWWDGYADFIPDSGDVNTETVDCTLRKIPDNLVDETDLAMVFPKGAQMLDAEMDLQRGLREARDEFLIDFGGKNRAHTALGVDVYRRPVALKFWLLRRHTMGDEWKGAMDGLQEEYEIALKKRIEQVPVDANQDNSTVGMDDGGITMIRLDRM